MSTSSAPDHRTTRLTALLYARLGRVLAAVGAITAVLLVPFLTMAPTESASTEPSGDVFTARDRIDDRFVSDVHATFVIVDHRGVDGQDGAGGDLLRAEPLAELLAANETVRNDPEIGPNLLRYYEDEVDADAVGIISLPELVDRELRTNGVDGLAAATDAEVKAVGATLIERYGERSDVLGISAQSTQDANGDWIVPAINYPVLAGTIQSPFASCVLWAEMPSTSDRSP